MGSKFGTAVVLAYVVQGAIGLPVFAGWKGGITTILGPTGGYILGFVPAAFLVGWLLEKGWYKRLGTIFSAFLIGNAIIYFFELPWLALFVGWNHVLEMGLLPFLPGDLIKLIIAISVARSLSRNLMRNMNLERGT